MWRDKAPFSATGITSSAGIANRSVCRVVALEGGDPQAIIAPLFGTWWYHLSITETSTSSYDIAPDGAEVASAADTDRSGSIPNFDVLIVPASGGEART